MNEQELLNKLQELKNLIDGLQRQVDDLRVILFKKTGGGASNIRTNDFKSDVLEIKPATATSTALLGFYGVTAVDRPATVSDAVTQTLTGADTIDVTKTQTALTSCKTAINLIIDRLQELGLIT